MGVEEQCTLVETVQGGMVLHVRELPLATGLDGCFGGVVAGLRKNIRGERSRPD